MSKYETYKTKKGTELPLMSLKGKPYMQVAQRLVWFTEEADSYSVSTNFHLLTADETVAHVVISVYDKDSKLIKQASATKRETKKDFADHTEKAETGAIGRALALLGYGTQFAIADLDEGDRLADSPIAVVGAAKTGYVSAVAAAPTEAVTTKKVTFSKKAVTPTTTTGDDI